MRRLRVHLAITLVIAGLLATQIVVAGVAADERKPAVAPVIPPFQNTWARTDQPVAAGRASRTWMWGPQAFTSGFTEPYAESPGGQRTVQYFDKTRMEVTNPNAVDDGVWYVTNGLLVVELVTGQLQTGNSRFESNQPAQINVVGDIDDTAGPTYATFTNLRNAPPIPDGATITQRVTRLGVVSNDQSLASYGVKVTHYVSETSHQIAAPFWSFMNATGTVYQNGAYTQAALFQNPFYATGYPITEPYWANVKVAGTFKDVLMQCFERRCLTYTPGNPEGWQVEAGNVGLHYYLWRHCGDSCQRILADDGGVLELPGEVRVTIPAGGLVDDAIISITRVGGVGGQAEGAVHALAETPVGDQYDIDSGGVGLTTNVSIEIAYNPAAIPAGMTESDIKLGYRDPATNTWITVPSQVDTSRNVVVGQTNHFSIWGPVIASGTQPQVPSAPTGLSANANGATQIHLQWLDNSNNEGGFRVYETTGGGSTLVASLGVNATSWDATNLASGSHHCYVVTAYNNSGESLPTNEGCATTGGSPPNAPSNLMAHTYSDTSIQLMWQDNSNNEDGWYIYLDGVQIPPVDPNSPCQPNTCYIINLQPDTYYCFYVSAYNEYGESDWSNEACAWTDSGGHAPNAPSHLEAYTYSSTEIQLFWNDNSTDEEGWYIYLDGQQFSAGTCQPNDCYFYGLQPDTYYCFNVSAYNEYGESDWSNQACAWTDSGGHAPNAPSHLEAYTYSSTEIQLFWNDNSTDEEGWYIYLDGQQFSAGTCQPNDCYFYGLQPDTYYCFYVSAYNDYGESDTSNQACAWTDSSGHAPNAPSYLEAYTYSTTEIQLYWQDNSNNEDGWYIYVDGVQAPPVDPSSPCQPDDCYVFNLQPNTYYCFYVSAFNEYGESDWSNEACAWTDSDSFSDENGVERGIKTARASALPGGAGSEAIE